MLCCRYIHHTSYIMKIWVKIKTTRTCQIHLFYKYIVKPVVGISKTNLTIIHQNTTTNLPKTIYHFVFGFFFVEFYFLYKFVVTERIKVITVLCQSFQHAPYTLYDIQHIHTYIFCLKELQCPEVGTFGIQGLFFMLQHMFQYISQFSFHLISTLRCDDKILNFFFFT